jgi:hypothetical protein
VLGVAQAVEGLGLVEPVADVTEDVDRVPIAGDGLGVLTKVVVG